MRELWNHVGCVAVLFASLSATAAWGQPTAPSTQGTRVRVRLTVDGKPYPGIVFASNQRQGVRGFAPAEGAMLGEIAAPFDLVFVNHPSEKKAYAGGAHVDPGQSEVLLQLKEIPWVPITISAKDEHGELIKDRRLKLVQTIGGREAWDSECVTNGEGEATINCVAGAVYHMECNRPEATGIVISKDFATADLPNSQFAFLVPTLESVSFRFRFVLKTAGRVQPVEVEGCEVAEAGGYRPIRGAFFLRPDREVSGRHRLLEGSQCHLRLPDAVARQYDFADRNGLLTIGKLGEMADVELVPRIRHRLAVAVQGPDGKALDGATITYRNAGGGEWRAGSAALEELLPGQYELLAWVPGYRLGSQTLDSAAGQAMLRLEEGPEASLTVVGADGKPIAAPITVCYAAKDFGPHLQRLRTDENGRASVRYDDTHQPVAVIYAKGYPPHAVRLGKTSEAHAIRLAQPAATKVNLAGDLKGKLPAGAPTRITWVLTAPARLRIGGTTLVDGAGEALLEPGEYLPIIEFTDHGSASAPTTDPNKAVVCKPVTITADSAPVQIVPQDVRSVRELVDGPG